MELISFFKNTINEFNHVKKMTGGQNV